MCNRDFSNVIALETHWIRHGIEFMEEAGEGKQEMPNPPPLPERAAKASFTGIQLKVGQVMLCYVMLC